MSNADPAGIAGTSAIQTERDRGAESVPGRDPLRDQGQPGETRRLPSPERNRTVMPLDLRQTKFGTAWRGFHRAEVTAFLLDAGDGYERALRENERLRQEIARLEASLDQFRVLESSLKSTMVTAQQVADGMRENAVQESTRIVREAEDRAGLLMEKAHARLEDVQREIDGLRLKRREAETSLEAIISALHHTLEFVRDQEQRERQDRGGEGFRAHLSGLRAVLGPRA